MNLKPKMIQGKRITKRSSSSPSENNLRERFVDLFKNCPVPDNELLYTSGTDAFAIRRLDCKDM